MMEAPQTETLEKNRHVLSVVRDTTSRVFSTMLSLQVTQTSAKVETRATVPTQGITAMVGMAGSRERQRLCLFQQNVRLSGGVPIPHGRISRRSMTKCSMLPPNSAT